VAPTTTPPIGSGGGVLSSLEDKSGDTSSSFSDVANVMVAGLTSKKSQSQSLESDSIVSSRSGVLLEDMDHMSSYSIMSQTAAGNGGGDRIEDS
jgi:hypothetical protein